MSDPIASAPHLPWRPEQSRAVLRGALVVKLAAGEAPAHIPYRHDVARGKVAAPLSVDGGGRVDRALHAHTPAMRVTRAFAPAERIGGGPTARARGASWSDIEEKTGLSQERFAALLGVSIRTLQDWEQGRRAPSGAARTLLLIAERNPKALLDVA